MSGEPPSQVSRYLNAKALASAADDQARKQADENRQSYERFYHNLALFSSGTIALSITFLGFLKSVQAITTHKVLLIGSWSCLMATLILSLFATLFYSHYVHYSGLRQMRQHKAGQYEAELEALPFLNYVELSNPQTQLKYRDNLVSAIEVSKGDTTWARRREKWYWHVWTWSGRLAQLSFVTGLALLLWFVIINT